MTEWLVPTIMGVQAVLLAIISRLRFRCFLVSSDYIDAHEYEVGNGQRVLVVSAKT